MIDISQNINFCTWTLMSFLFFFFSKEREGDREKEERERQRERESERETKKDEIERRVQKVTFCDWSMWSYVTSIMHKSCTIDTGSMLDIRVLNIDQPSDVSTIDKFVWSLDLLLFSNSLIF